MKVKRSRSILRTIFVPYTTLFGILFICFTSFFVITETRKIHDNTFSSIENNLISTSENFNQLIKSLDSMSQNVLYSNLVKDHFKKYIDYTKVSSSTQNYKSIQNTKTLYELLVALIGPNAPVEQIYLYGLNNGCFGVGLDNSSSSQSVKDYSWYNAIIEHNGEKYVILDSDERLSPYYSYKEGRYFLSLIRQYYSSLNVPQGIIEVKKSMTPFIKTLSSYNRNYNEEYYIFSPEGKVIYPIYDTNGKGPEYNNIIKDSSIDSTALDKSLMKRKVNDYVIYQTSKYSGFTVAVVVDNASLMSPVWDYIKNMALLLLGICLATIFLSYTISQQLSKPLGQIYSRIHSFRVNSATITDMELPAVNTSVIELNELYQALVTMQTRARAALENELKLQNQEMQSRMLALQAQMNPHFLYNSLATIQAMATEGMTKEIDMMCQNMSSILRYISSDSQQLVDIEDEVIHTKAYLECMRLRYCDELSYNFDIPTDMNHCKIPKLCLQLIVENAVKFTTRKRGPWIITVTGQRTTFEWELQIKDNGPGFTQEELDSLYAKMKIIDETGELPNLEINGMGLMHIYIRLKLLYKQAPIYRLANNWPEGASVTIGGYIQ